MSYSFVFMCVGANRILYTQTQTELFVLLPKHVILRKYMKSGEKLNTHRLDPRKLAKYMYVSLSLFLSSPIHTKQFTLCGVQAKKNMQKTLQSFYMISRFGARVFVRVC